jgi:hypothetical protein
VSLSIRATPTTNLNGTVRAELDSRTRELRTVSVNTTYNWSGRLQSTICWTKRFYIADLIGFNDTNTLDDSLNASTNVHTIDRFVRTIKESCARRQLHLPQKSLTPRNPVWIT